MDLSTSWIIGGTLAPGVSSALEWRVSWGIGAGSKGSKSLLGAKVLGTLRDIFVWIVNLSPGSIPVA